MFYLEFPKVQNFNLVLQEPSAKCQDDFKKLFFKFEATLADLIMITYCIFHLRNNSWEETLLPF